MLAGLLFARAETADPPARPVAVLPFAGGTLIEHQADQLIEAGAGQIVVIADRQAEALAGAFHRLARRGVILDVAATAAEAAAALHPLARVVVMADGLVTTPAAVALAAHGEGEALLALPADGAPAAFERIGGALAWAGIARIESRRLAEVAALPADYDLQSALLRVVEAGGAARLPLPLEALQHGHGIERDAAALAGRLHRVAAGIVRERHGWFDRWLATPLLRAVLPVLIGREVPTGAVACVAGVGAAAGLGLLAAREPAAGLALSFVALLTGAAAASLALLRRQPAVARGAEAAMLAGPALAALLLGRSVGEAQGDGTPLVVALALVAFAAIGVRAAPLTRRWWGSAPAYLLVVLLATLAGVPAAGLAVAAVYAAATLAAAVEGLRRDA